MLELVIVYCMIGAPDRCVERGQIMQEGVSQIGCVTLGQMMGQEYLKTHPNWRLATWRCQDARRHEEHA
jgi:hypothetical protein